MVHSQWLQAALDEFDNASTTTDRWDALYVVLYNIIRVLETFRQTYLHIGKAGMIIGVDGTNTTTSITRRAPTP